jgi:transcriptional regulator with XRE-family HTH domain
MHKMPQIKRPMSEVTAAIEAWMKQAGFTKNSLAKHLNMPQSQVWRALKGQLPESSTALNRLCTAAGVSVHKTVGPWDSKIITTAVEDAWDGTEEGARAIAMLLIAARALSVLKTGQGSLPEAR